MEEEGKEGGGGSGGREGGREANIVCNASQNLLNLNLRLEVWGSGVGCSPRLSVSDHCGAEAEPERT